MYASQKFVMPEGLVTVKIVGALEYITISGGCPDFLSGVILRGWNKIDGAVPVPNQVMESFYPSIGYARGETRGWQTTKAYPPMREKTHGVDFIKFRLEGLTHKRVPPPDVVPPPPYVAYTDFPQVAVIRPGMYSGTMRSVVQYMLGAKVPIKFGYHFSCTHGIMKVPSKSGKIVPWVIEISTQFGVLATKLNVCRQTKNKSALGYVPLGAMLPCASAEVLERLIKKGLVIQLLPASALTQFSSKGGIFSECGWAFSYTGLEAQNTAVGKLGIYKTCHRYKLVFSHIDGKPASAVFSEVNSGFMISNPGAEFARSQVRVPSYPLQGCITLDMKPDTANVQTVDSICPVYVYYNGDAEQIVTWWNERLVIRTTPAFPLWSTFDPDNEAAYGIPYKFNGSSDGSSARFYQITSPVFPTPQLFTMEANVTTYTPMMNAGFKKYNWAPDGALTSGLTTMSRMTPFTILVGIPEGQGMGSRHTVTIPLYERELVYHMREEIDYSTSIGTGSIGMTRFHSNSITADYYMHRLINNLGEQYGDYIWEFRSFSPPSGLSGVGGSVEGAFSLGWPEAMFGTSFQGPERFDRYVALPVPNFVRIPTIADRPSVKRVAVAGSAFPTQEAGIFSTVDQWYKLLPDALSFVSQLWVARSADGLYVIPKKERYTGMNESDFLHNIINYPANDVTLSAPTIAFVGNAADLSINLLSQ